MICPEGVESVTLAEMPSRLVLVKPYNYKYAAFWRLLKSLENSPTRYGFIYGFTVLRAYGFSLYGVPD